MCYPKVVFIFKKYMMEIHTRHFPLKNINWIFLTEIDDDQDETLESWRRKGLIFMGHFLISHSFWEKLITFRTNVIIVIVFSEVVPLTFCVNTSKEKLLFPKDNDRSRTTSN